MIDPPQAHAGHMWQLALVLSARMTCVALHQCNSVTLPHIDEQYERITWCLTGHLFMVCQPILDRIDPCQPKHQVLVEASHKAWDLPKGFADSWWPRKALRKQLKHMLDVIESWGSAPDEVSATAVCCAVAAAQSVP